MVLYLFHHFFKKFFVYYIGSTQEVYNFFSASETTLYERLIKINRKTCVGITVKNIWSVEKIILKYNIIIL